MSANRYFARPSYLPGFNWMAAAEATLTGTTLQDVDAANSTKIQLSYAGDLNFRAQYRKVRLKADFEMRSLGYILQNQPSLVPYQDFPAGASQTPEIFGSLGFDYWLERVNMTLGLTAGVQQPATFTPPSGQSISGSLQGNVGGTLSTAATIVVRNEGDLSILPEPMMGAQQNALPIFGTKLEVREDFIEWFAAIVQVYYEYDHNQTKLFKAEDGTSLRDYNYPHRLGFNITLQARY